MDYKFDTNGEVTNITPELDSGDFRIYPVEVMKDEHGQPIEMQLCAELIGGRWEYFYSDKTQ